MDSLSIHMVDGISTAATYTNHLDDTILFFWLSEVQWCIVCHNLFLFFVFTHVR